MRIVQASDARTELPSLLNEVEQGETILITRRGKTVARIIPEREFPVEARRQSIDAVKALSNLLPSASLDEILSFRHEGHRY